MRNYIGFLIFKSLSSLPLGILRSLGDLAGRCHWLLNTRAKRTTLINLAICFPNMEKPNRDYLAKQSLRETMKTLFEAGIIWRRDWNWLQSRIVSVTGEDILLEKYKRGKGLLVITLHMGNWEVVGPYLASLVPLTALYQTTKYPKMDQWVVDAREKKNIGLAPSNTQGVKKIMQALRAKQAVCILPDQVPDRNTGRIISRFFTKPAWTMSLVHSLISRTGCDVCFCYALRHPRGFEVHIVDANQAITNEDLPISITAMNADLESIVRVAPEQYQWEYKRFRQLPSNDWVEYS
jgi:Kdo2-lipid IVA lauroyltransferase/acyltransferase